MEQLRDVSGPHLPMFLMSIWGMLATNRLGCWTVNDRQVSCKSSIDLQVDHSTIVGLDVLYVFPLKLSRDSIARRRDSTYHLNILYIVVDTAHDRRPPPVAML